MGDSSKAGFKDHYSGHADLYRAFRPTYPAALFEHLASLALGHDLAWDCATGNGQAALALTPFFRSVVATDASSQQVAQARPHDRITYRVAPAERTALGDASVDLVTVAQALHWFDLPAFYAEVRRVRGSLETPPARDIRERPSPRSLAVRSVATGRGLRATPP
jgi:hypothetical protein